MEEGGGRGGENTSVPHIHAVGPALLSEQQAGAKWEIVTNRKQETVKQSRPETESLVGAEVSSPTAGHWVTREGLTSLSGILGEIQNRTLLNVGI